MKYLYLQFLKFQVWILRRRLRRMGFREVTKQITPEMLRHLLRDDPQKVALDWIKVGLTAIAVLGLCLILWLCYRHAL